MRLSLPRAIAQLQMVGNRANGDAQVPTVGS
jgi:hypothetical protein